VQLADVITSLRRHWLAALAAVVLVAVGLAGFLLRRDQTSPPNRWLASVQILVPARDDEGNLPPGVPPMLLHGQSAIALSAEVTGEALEAAGLNPDARRDVSFDFASEGDIVELSVKTPTRELSRDLADSFAAEYIEARGEAVSAGSRGESSAAQRNLTTLQQRLGEVEAELRRLNPGLLSNLPDTARPRDEESGAEEAEEEAPTVDLPPSTPIEIQLLVSERQDLLQDLATMRQTYGQRSTDALVPQAHAQVVERVAPVNVTPAPPTPLVPIAVGVGIAALLALAVPVLLDRIDHSIRDSHTAGTALAAPVLSTIPARPGSKLETLARPGSPGGHAYRTLATASVATDQLPRAIVVTAPVGQMQDTVAANFAAALADLGLRVVLVPTHPRQSWYADAPDGALRLPDLLALAYTGRLNGEVPGQLQPTPVDNLRILPHGDTEADALIDGLPPLLRAFADGGVDVAVIAAPSILEDPSATILAWSTRSVLWVVETGEVTQQQASEAAAKLELAGASPFGIAVVDGKG
jgi:Mrp family chromosome partitioning ATPase